MNDNSSDSGCQQGDGNIHKKSKKRKRKTCDSVSCEDPSDVKDGSVGEIEADMVLLKAKKNKIKKKSHHEDVTVVYQEAKKHKKKREESHCEEDTAVQIKDTGEVLQEAKKRKKKKKLHHEKETAIQTESVENLEGPDEETVIKMKKKKKKSAKDGIVEENFDGVEKNDKHGVSSKKKKKQKSAQDSCAEENLVDGGKVEKDSVDNSLLKKKKKKRKLVSDEEDFDVVISGEEVVVDGKLSKEGKKKPVLNDTCHDGVVQVEELLPPKKKKRKSGTDGSVEDSIDSAVMKDSQETKRNQRSKDTDNLSGNTSVYQKQSLQMKKMKQGCVNNPYVWTRPGIIRSKWGQKRNQKTIPKYLTIPPQNVEGWQSMVFKFDNHPKVRHYIPRKLMAMNGIKQQLGEMDEVHLKIPNILFQGSSLYDIPGYGYGIPD